MPPVIGLIKKLMMIIESFPIKNMAMKSLNSTNNPKNPLVNTLINKIIP